jgi:uncharacterized membrane protein YccC
VAWGLLSMPLDRWSVSLTMMLLTFVVEMLVVRHYVLAVVFITPLTILLADAPALQSGSGTVLVQARFLDTVLGCLVGFVGGVCLHSPRFRSALGQRMRRFVPARFMHPRPEEL